MAKKGQKFKMRDEKLINKIVQEKLVEGKTYSHLERKYKIPGGTIMTWVKRYKTHGHVNRHKKGIEKQTKNMTIEELRLTVEILKKFQAFLKSQQVKR